MLSMLVCFTSGLIGDTINMANFSDKFASLSSSWEPAILIRDCRKKKLFPEKQNPILIEILMMLHVTATNNNTKIC